MYKRVLKYWIMTPELIDEKVASMSCKAAVKGNNRLSAQEVDELIAELKMPDLNAASLETAESMIAGTCRSMGVVVEE